MLKKINWGKVLIGLKKTLICFLVLNFSIYFIFLANIQTGLATDLNQTFGEPSSRYDCPEKLNDVSDAREIARDVTLTTENTSDTTKRKLNISVRAGIQTFEIWGNVHGGFIGDDLWHNVKFRLEDVNVYLKRIDTGQEQLIYTSPSNYYQKIDFSYDISVPTPWPDSQTTIEYQIIAKTTYKNLCYPTKSDPFCEKQWLAPEESTYGCWKETIVPDSVVPYSMTKDQTSTECQILANQAGEKQCLAVQQLKILYDEYQVVKGGGSSPLWEHTVMTYDLNFDIFSTSFNWSAMESSPLTNTGKGYLNNAKQAAGQSKWYIEQMKSKGCANRIPVCTFADPFNQNTTKSIEEMEQVLAGVISVAGLIEEQQTTGSTGKCGEYCNTKLKNADTPTMFICTAMCWISKVFAKIVEWGFELFKGAMSTESDTPYVPGSNPDFSVDVGGESGGSGGTTGGGSSSGSSPTTTPTIHSGGLTLPTPTSESPIEEIPISPSPAGGGNGPEIL